MGQWLSRRNEDVEQLERGANPYRYPPSTGKVKESINGNEPPNWERLMFIHQERTLRVVFNWVVNGSTRRSPRATFLVIIVT